jgi:hypothetical protein
VSARRGAGSERGAALALLLDKQIDIPRWAVGSADGVPDDADSRPGNAPELSSALPSCPMHVRAS